MKWAVLSGFLARCSIAWVRARCLGINRMIHKWPTPDLNYKSISKPAGPRLRSGPFGPSEHLRPNSGCSPVYGTVRPGPDLRPNYLKVGTSLGLDLDLLKDTFGWKKTILGTAIILTKQNAHKQAAEITLIGWFSPVSPVDIPTYGRVTLSQSAPWNSGGPVYLCPPWNTTPLHTA